MKKDGSFIFEKFGKHNMVFDISLLLDTYKNLIDQYNIDIIKKEVLNSITIVNQLGMTVFNDLEYFKYYITYNKKTKHTNI